MRTSDKDLLKSIELKASSKSIGKEKLNSVVEQSKYISRDLSWLQFNFRVLEQAKSPERSIFDRLRFLSITASNLDEFFMIRAGSLYNYLDYEKERIDYSGLRARPFKKVMFDAAQEFYEAQQHYFKKGLQPEFAKNGFRIVSVADLEEHEVQEIKLYFLATIYPMLTPMVYDNYRSFPLLMNKSMNFGVITRSEENGKEDRKLTFIQIPQNLPRFYEFDRDHELVFVSIEDIIHLHIEKLFRNIHILDVSLFRITRNGDITLEESDDIEDDFLNEIKQKIKTRKSGRVVRIEVQKGYSELMVKILKKRWNLDEDNIFVVDKFLDFTGLGQIFNHEEFKDFSSRAPAQVPPIGYQPDVDIFEQLKHRDILLHQPYNSFEPVLELLERAAEDPEVLAIKITIYRLAKNSRISAALLRAAENGKHVSVLFELKARFDEENNIREAERLQKAGCFVIYGISGLKTHTKMLMIVRKEDRQIIRYVHMSSGNYNESTTKFYSDVSVLTTDEDYAHDVSEFFNVITGHSHPHFYKNLITSPRDMRKDLASLIRKEAENAQKGLPCGVVIKINSLEDQQIIDELYAASQMGVPVKLIVRGICCLRPQRVGLSENIMVKSIVGDYLEHSRLYYFHNNNEPIVYGGSADLMVRSFDRRIESLFLLNDDFCRQQATNILEYNLRDNQNSFMMQEDGSYLKYELQADEPPFNVHKAFFSLQEEEVRQTKLF
ncbi:MAG TPA: polyphosphate kinase 1 [Microscillaceae bacterium]|nr:polyphosphate kinase 1 [Microscillaceae bacterium]